MNKSQSQLAPISANIFLKSMFKFSIATWISAIINFISVPILTRVLAPNVYGLINMFNSASTFLMGLVTLGVFDGFIRFYNDLPKGYDKKNLAQSCLGIPILTLFILGIFVSGIFYKQFSMLVFKEVSFIITCLLFGSAFANLFLRFLTIYNRMSSNVLLYTIQSVSVQIISKGLILIPAIFTKSFEKVIIVNVIGMFLLACIFFYVQRKDIYDFNKKIPLKDFKGVFRFSIFSWPAIIVLFGNTFFTQLIINNFLDSYNVGIYASTSLFIGLLGIIQSGFNSYWSPFMYKYYKTEQRLIKQVHSYVLIITTLLLCMFIFFRDILFTLIGSEYHEAKPIFALVLIGSLLSMIIETTGYGSNIAKKSYLTTITTIITTITNIGLCLILIPIFGITGAAFATMISSTINLVMATIFGQRFYRSIQSPLKTIYSVIMLVLLACINFYFSNQQVILNTLVLTVIFPFLILFKNDIKGMYSFFKKYLKGISR